MRADKGLMFKQMFAAVAATVVMSSASLAQPDLVPAAPSVAASAYFLMDAN